ncbi:uncharacterized protein LOC144628839 [Oculina patagonica]
MSGSHVSQQDRSELSNRAAQGQAFCNMGFAQSQLGEYNKAGESFTHAIQAAKDANDKRGLWQAYEGLAAVSFLGQEYDKAVEYYKLALSVLSTTGEVDPEHNNRIVSKLANALECHLVLSKKLNGRLPPLRADSVKSDAAVTKERVGKGKRVGKTRSRQEHHQLIARGIDGDQTPSESEEPDGDQDTESSESDDSEEETRQNEQATRDRQHRQRTITTEADVHYERKPTSEKRGRKMTSTDSTDEEQVIKDRERRERKTRHSRKARHTSFREPLKSTQGENYYEQAVDDRIASPARSDYSDDMPRSHREAYLASVQASAGHRSDPKGTDVQDGQSVQSRTCVIQ